MVIKSVVGQSRMGVEEPLELNVLVERPKESYITTVALSRTIFNTW